MSMRSSRILLALLLLAAPCLPAADALPGELIPPEARVVIGIHVGNLSRAFAASDFAAELKSQSSAILAQTPLAGFDPMKDLDEVLIASAGGGPNAPTLVVIRGRFDVERLGNGAKRYHDVPLLEDPRQANSAMALLDANTALAGDLPLVRAAIDRRGQGARMNAALAARIEPMRSRYEIWGAGDIPEAAPAAAAAGAPNPFEAIDRFQFGASVSHGLQFVAELRARNRQEAEKLATLVQMWQTMLKNPQTSGAKIQIASENSTLKLDITIPEEEWKKALAGQQQAFQAALANQLKVRKADPPPGIVTGPKGDTTQVQLPGAK